MIKLVDIRKSFGEVEVLHGITLEIGEGLVLSIVGENGAGKTTLMRILSGIITDFSGKMFVNGKEIRFSGPKDAEKHGISIIHQELSLFKDLSVAENIFISNLPLKNCGFIDYKLLYRKAEEYLSSIKFPFSPDIKVGNLPIGWQQMVEIARAICNSSDVIIMDEPTSALSELEIDFLFGEIRRLVSDGKTVIFISHRLKEVLEISDEIVVIRDGQVVKKFYKEEFDRDKIVSCMVGNDLARKSLKVCNSAKKNGKEILKFENVNVRLQNGKNLSGLSFNLNEGEVLGITGLLGAGKTELMKFIFGEMPARYNGEIYFLGKEYRPIDPAQSLLMGIAYLTEDRRGEGLFFEHDIVFNDTISSLEDLFPYGVINKELERQIVKKDVEKFNIKVSSPECNVLTLSGGNQQKVLLSRVLNTNPVLLLLDEPTRGIDIGAKREIYDIIGNLSRKGIAIIISSSEIEELLMVCHRILVLSNGHQVACKDVKELDQQKILTYSFSRV